MPAPRHLVAVWNPSYAVDAMDAHIRLLLQNRQRHDEAPHAWHAETACVYWGKVKSPNRRQRFSHDDVLRELAAEIGGDDDAPRRELHLYLTDYRSLHVGHVVDVMQAIDADDHGEYAPRYYAEGGLAVDWWFCLADIRCLVRDDLDEVIAQLRLLRNVNYHDRPVSLYGGMVDLPLVVTRDDGVTWFDDDERRLITGGTLWAAHDRTRGDTGAVARDLRENLLGDLAWHGLHTKVRGFVASAEEVLRRKRADTGFDFATAMSGYAKALEVQANHVIRSVAHRLRAEERLAKVGDRTIDVGERSLTLGQLAHALAGEPKLCEGLRRALVHGEWFTYEFPAILDRFVTELRNDGTHAEAVLRDDALRWRAAIMGVGCTGALVELARVQPRH